MPRKVIVLIAIFLFVVAVVIVYSVYSPKATKQPSSQSTPAPSIVQPTPVSADTVRGSVVSVSSTSLVVRSVGGTEQTISLAGTADFQKVLSGSITAGSAQFAQATLSDLKAGQEVLVAVDKKTGAALTIIIVK